MAAHDLASPIGTASLMLQMLAIKAEIRDNITAKTTIRDVVNVLQGSSANISTILILQKYFLTGDLPLQVCDLQTIALNVQARLKAMLDAASAQMHVAALPTCKCHPTVVEALLQNLVENSVKYRSEDNPSITISSEFVNSMPIFSIEDNGVGISDDNREKVFGLFHKGDDVQPGLGIGLNLCRNIVEAHGGSIWIDESYLAGTRICFTLARPL